MKKPAEFGKSAVLGYSSKRYCLTNPLCRRFSCISHVHARRFGWLRHLRRFIARHRTSVTADSMDASNRKYLHFTPLHPSSAHIHQSSDARSGGVLQGTSRCVCVLSPLDSVRLRIRLPARSIPISSSSGGHIRRRERAKLRPFPGSCRWFRAHDDVRRVPIVVLSVLECWARSRSRETG